MKDSLATQLEFISKTKYLPWEAGEPFVKLPTTITNFLHCKDTATMHEYQIFGTKRFPRAFCKLLIISELKKYFLRIFHLIDYQRVTAVYIGGSGKVA